MFGSQSRLGSEAHPHRLLAFRSVVEVWAKEREFLLIDLCALGLLNVFFGDLRQNWGFWRSAIRGRYFRHFHKYKIMHMEILRCVIEYTKSIAKSIMNACPISLEAFTPSKTVKHDRSDHIYWKNRFAPGYKQTQLSWSLVKTSHGQM